MCKALGFKDGIQLGYVTNAVVDIGAANDVPILRMNPGCGVNDTSLDQCANWNSVTSTLGRFAKCNHKDDLVVLCQHQGEWYTFIHLQ